MTRASSEPLACSICGGHFDLVPGEVLVEAGDGFAHEVCKRGRHLIARRRIATEIWLLLAFCAAIYGAVCLVAWATRTR